jgi:hypothetical protein
LAKDIRALFDVERVQQPFPSSRWKTNGYSGAPGGAILHLRMLETVASKANYLWRRALQPNHLDADFIRLPDSLAPAYYLIRPVRVACAALGRLRPQ